MAAQAVWLGHVRSLVWQRVIPSGQCVRHDGQGIYEEHIDPDVAT